MGRFRVVVVVVFALAWGMLARASGLGHLVVVVSDPDGLPVPEASVEVVSPSMIGTRRGVTDAAGTSAVLGLVPGSYTVVVNRAGFGEAVTVTSVVQDRTVDVDVQLEPAVLSEVVDVTGTAPLVGTRTSTVADHVTVAEVDAVPVGRDYRAYPQLVAGVGVAPNPSGIETRYEPASKAGNYYHDRGAAMGSRDNVYLFEGFDITDMAGGTGTMTLNNRAILEEAVITSGVPAEYPGGAGYVAAIVTRVGGNTVAGSVEYFAQRPWMTSAAETADSRLRIAEENAYDTGFTVGGPLLRDRAWFFVAGQQRENSDDVPLSTSASPTPRTEVYSFRRRNGLAKIVARPTVSATMTLTAFADPRRTDGSRDVTVPTWRYSTVRDDSRGAGIRADLLPGESTLVEADGFTWEQTWRSVPSAPEYGPPNTLLFEPGVTAPGWQRLLGSSGDAGRTVHGKDAATASLTTFLEAAGTHQVKTGVQWKRWHESNDTERFFGVALSSLAPHLAGTTFAEARDLDLLPGSEYDFIFRALTASPGSAAFVAADADHDGVVTAAEFAALTFASTAGNQGGVNFLRQSLVHAGVNDVGQTAWAIYVQDDWRLGRWTVNAGVRGEKVRYFASDGSTILGMPTEVYPRLGVAFDVGGDGRQRLSLAYGAYSDPLLTPMIRFAGNLSGNVYHDQVFIGGDWFTYRERGSSVVTRDAGFAPDLRNEVERELQLTYGINLSPTAALLAQAYYRRDSHLIEDYDPAVYFSPDAAGWLVLSPSQFGYPPSGPTGVNYFLGNLVGGVRRAWGLDLSLQKRLSDGWNGAVQYSFKRAFGNSNSNAAADLQGDFLALDPRQPYMYGRLPGTIPHQVKVFGSWTAPVGVSVGGLFYWNSGAVFTESDVFRPSTHDIYYNHRRDDGSYVRTGGEHHPSYSTLDVRVSYRISVGRVGDAELILDVMNALDSQKAIRVEEAHNDPEFAYGEARLLQAPRRYQIGARFSW